jgi:thiol-disulfide isomerase/thioredoxin
LCYCGRSNNNEQRLTIGLQFGQKFFNLAFCSYLHLQFFNWAAVPGGRFSNSTTTQSPIVMCNNMRPLKFIAAFLALGLQSFGQTNIQIVIKNDGNHKIDKVDVFDLSQKEIFKMPYNDTLNFVFAKNNIDCYNIRYHENGKMYRQQIWLNTGQIKIEAHLDSSKLQIDSVFNSPIYYEHMNFRRNYSELYKKKDTTAINKMLLEKFSKNIDNPYSLEFANYYILLNQNSNTNLSKLKLLTDKQGDRFNWFAIYPSVVGRLNNILTNSSLSLNDYSFIDRQNKNVKITPLTKKFYILDFWFLGCAPCLKDHIEIKKQLKTLDDKNAEVISISTDNDIKKLNTYLRKNKYNWQNYLESETKKITKEFSITGFPTYIIIDNLGNIKSTQNSFFDVLKYLDKE